MKLIAFLIAAAALIVIGGASPPALAQVCTNGALNDVHFVTTPFAPATNATPMAASSPSVPPDVQADLKNAFAAASPAFQYKLCGLDGIFIDPSGCTNPSDPTTCNLTGALVPDYSWGLRTYPPNPSPGKRYIGLSLGLWNNINSKNPKTYQWNCAPSHYCPPPFSLFYTAFIDTVIHLRNASPYPVSVTVKPDSFAQSSAMSTLAVLAHEFGHVYWFDSFVDNPGGRFSNNFCGGIFYPSGNWQRNAVTLPFPNTTRFVAFGDVMSQAGSYVGGLPGSLHSLFAPGNWASALAAFSPNEDFVETFELKQLVNARPSGLTLLQINRDVVVPVPAGSWLAWKIGCFS